MNGKKALFDTRLILATAIAENLQLVSRDVDDFSNIDVNVLNPFE